MEDKRIPRATAKRIPLYYRYLQMLYADGITRVSSKELSQIAKIESATIRRDFSNFDRLGRRGYGYDVKSLLDYFNSILSQDKLTHVALVGLGNLGQALLNYRFPKSNNVRISAAFDVDKSLIGTVQSGVPVYDIAELGTQLNQQQINIAILTVPIEKAQEMTDVIVDAGAKGILNFTPIRLTVPDSVRVQDVDLANELQTLIYFLESDNIKK